MNLTGRMCGVDVVYGGRWDDLAGGAAFKVTHNGVTGYFDGRNMDLSLVPAPAVAQRAAGSDDDGMAQAIFYYDESASIFGSVIFSGGKIAPLSETIHDDVDAWAAAIESSLKDPNLDIVHVPKEIIAPKVEKVRLYDLGQMVDRKKLPRLSSTSSLRNLVGGLLITLLMSGIAMGAWTYLSKRLTPPEPEIVMVRENRVPLFGDILSACAEDLSAPWPAPPEWELIREGCVADWGLAQLSGLMPPDPTPHSYRLYQISGQTWDPYLSRLAFLKISERFAGRVIEGSNQFLLYLPYELETRLVDNAYLPDTAPADLVRSRFVGAVEIQGGVGLEAFSASSPLELSEVLNRLSGERLTPGHVFHDLRGQQTGFRFGPEWMETRQVRAN